MFMKLNQRTMTLELKNFNPLKFMKYYFYFKDLAVVHSIGKAQESAQYKRTCEALLNGWLPPVLVSLCCALL